MAARWRAEEKGRGCITGDAAASRLRVAGGGSGRTPPCGERGGAAAAPPLRGGEEAGDSTGGGGGAAPGRSPVDWPQHQAELDRRFHGPDDHFPRGSAEHDELQDFIPKLARYTTLQHTRKSAEGPAASPAGQEEQDVALAEQLELPEKYDMRYRVNVAVLGATQQKPFGCDEGGLDASALAEYCRMLILYEDFLQKRLFAKLVKLRKDQASLPIASFEEDILKAVEHNPVVVIAGETGCGKSTQVPQMLLRAGYRQIACTQPRRLSAISLCRRVAYETLHEHGSAVAFKIRFDSTRTAATRILFLTEGVLLRELMTNAELSHYNVIIIDEVHERHLNTDLLLALLRDVIARRPELRMILMSATINVNTYAAYFGGAPVVQVPGRLYPTTIEYISDERSDDGLSTERSMEGSDVNARPDKRKPRLERLDTRPYLRILERVDQQFPPEQRGDMLIFLSGMQEITTLADAIRAYADHTRRWIVLLLHSALSDKVFDLPPEGVRKVILSTNLAETSVTIDGVRFVVDSGRPKEMLHDLTSGGASLQEGWISKASAQQRAGRAGRTGPGHCYRLYSLSQYKQMPDYSTPEIHRVALEPVVLQIKMLRAGDPRTFGFLEPPSEDAVVKALTSLRQLDALTNDAPLGSESLTPLGEVLAPLPVDVSVGKMLVLGSNFHLSKPTVIIAAALSVQSPYIRLPDNESSIAVREARRAFHSEQGDAFSLLQIFNEWIQLKGHSSRTQSSRKWCKRVGLEEQRLYEVAKLQRQFQDLLHDQGLLHLEAASHGAGEQEGMKEEAGGWGRTWQRGSAGRERREALLRLRQLQSEQAREKGRRTLSLAGEEVEGSSGDEDTVLAEEGGKKRKGRGGEEEGEDQEDFKSIELRLAVDVDSMATAASCKLKRQDVNLLKFIICSGLYPQLAVADKNNHIRRAMEHTYHTKFKTNARLYPASVLATADIPISPEEVLPYASLLETTKLYLTNLIRVPSLPALLLTAHSIDTSLDMRLLLFDEWLLVRVTEAPEVAQHLVLEEAVDSSQSSSLPLDGLPDFAMEIVVTTAIHQETPRVSVLSERLADFLDSTVRYTCDQPLRSIVTALLERNSLKWPTTEPTTGSQRLDKGGQLLTTFLRMGSLPGDDISSTSLPNLRKHWTCLECGVQMLATLADIERHLETCKARTTISKPPARGAAWVPLEDRAGAASEVSSSKDARAASEANSLQPLRLADTVDEHSGGTEGEGSKHDGSRRGEASQEAQAATEHSGGGDDAVSPATRRRYDCPQCDGKVYLFTGPQIFQHKKGHERA
eukprot:SM000004S15036  [mRNA]  locus=s4:961290:971083:+ [translate_table: standard]